MAINEISAKDREAFHEHLQKSTRILALCGAGLSASSGLPTFRGAGGLWRNYDATALATPEAFEEQPDLVWQFYSHRRHMALNVNPNPAHYALAELARKRPEFITLTQNVDGLSPRANHPASQLHLLHGSLFDVRCTSFYCDYAEKDNFVDPIVPALAIPTSGQEDADISDAKIPMAAIPTEDLPQCPKCKKGLLRPGVVWFGEALPANTLKAVDEFIEDKGGKTQTSAGDLVTGSKIDLMLVIGTSGQVFPAAAYMDIARRKGARVAVINMDKKDGKKGLAKGDWFFQGDAATILPDILSPVIGDISALHSGSTQA
ncbi:MAG: hypothetical protein Q9218_005667 [Villophora microphyllina]